MSNRMRVALLAPCFLLMAGCVSKSASGDGVSIHFSWWVPIVILGGAVAAVPIGFLLRNLSSRLGWGLMIGGVICAVIAPSFFFESVFVSDKGFDVHSGIFGMTANQKVEFGSLKSITVGTEMTTGRGARRIEVLYFDAQSGPPSKLSLNNDVKIEARKEILPRAVKAGVPVMTR